jgi:hypothetical protein
MQSEPLDNFEDLSGWTPIASGQAQLSLSPDEGPSGKAMRLDFDFRGGGGFVVARKAFTLELPDKPAGQPVCTTEPPAGGSAGIALPESYSFDIQIRGIAPSNIFEFKLVDTSGQNVWRYRVEEFEFPEEWQPVRIRSSRIEFAWGPLGGGPARNIAAIELVIAAGPGGQGTVWLADLRFRDDTYRSVPAVSASSAAPGHPPDQALAADGSWRSEASAPQWLLIDFQREREYGGLVIDWEPGLTAREYEVEVSMDGSAWTTAYVTRQGAGRRSYAYLPDTCSRYLRLNLKRNIEGQGFGIRHIDVKPFDFSRTLNTFFESIAKACPAGFHPKYLLKRHKSAGSGFGLPEAGPKGEPQGRGEQTYWTPVGTGQGGTQALFNEEGMVEVDKGSFSVEPFLYTGGRLLTWADVTLAQGLEQDYLPIPWSEWRTEGLSLRTTAYATGRADPGCYDAADRPVLFIRYRVENTGTERQSVRLFAALRPFQVTPTWQHWRNFGGMAEIKALNYRDGVVWVNGNKAVIPLTPAAGFGAATFDEGAITEYLATGEPPLRTVVADEFGYGSGALRFDLDLAPGAAEEIYLAAPFGFEADAAAVAAVQAASGPAEFEHAVRSWETALNAAQIRLPPTAGDFAHTFKTAAAHILINRDGAALHPGPRRYNRSWIRDGVLMGAALLRVGCTEALRDFMRWYAQFQAEDGNLPDCADREGTEWLPEFDAYGQFIYGVMEYWRFTGDLGLVREMQPAAWKTLGYMEALRARRLTPEYQTPEKRASYGLLPESMSHEGYMAHPVHAYWDDFWALQGLKDAAAMAELLGDRSEAARLATLRDDFCRDLYASLDATIARHGIDFVPGSVEFGDFDPAATAIALSPIGEAHRLPRPAIDRTFDKYMEGFRERASGAVAWNNYSAYEVRIVGALLRLGRRKDALELAEFLLADRRIRCWNQWPEISWRDPQGPSFIGDLPHTWISGEYILAIRSLFAYERETDAALVIAAGIAEAWLADGFELAVENLPTWYGKLSYSLRLEAAGTLRLKLSGDLALPPGGIVVEPPLSRPILRVEADSGEPLDFAMESFTVRVVPAEVLVRF